jgi:glycosyltransferase involved in cell wall biosynthesis
MSKPKILYWTPEFYPEIGGIEELSRKVLPSFQALDYEFLVVASHGHLRLPDLSEFNGIPVHRYHFREALGTRNPRWILVLQKQIAALKRSFRPDLIHFHFGDPFGYFHLATASASAAPSLVTLHTSVTGYGGGVNTMIGKLLRQASWVGGVSKATLDDARQAAPEIVDRSSVIYNGLEQPELAPGPLPLIEPRLLCLGRVVKEKGFDLAISAFARIRPRFPRSRLIIAGDGRARMELERQAATLGLTNAVDFLGWVGPEKVPWLINQSTMVVLPSRWREPFPLVALQAAQMARPVVAARTGGMPESIIDHQTGLLVERENEEELAQAVIFLLEHSEQAIRYGQDARKRVQEAFGIERYVEAYDRLYKKLIRPGARDGTRKQTSVC